MPMTDTIHHVLQTHLLTAVQRDFPIDCTNIARVCFAPIVGGAATGESKAWIHFVAYPAIVVEIAYVEWADDGTLQNYWGVGFFEHCEACARTRYEED